MTENPHLTRFEPRLGRCGAVIVESLTITDNAVVREARRWATGHRGEPCESEDTLAQANLTTFATEAMVFGARVLAATAQTGEARAVEQMLKDLGDRTQQATSSVEVVTGQVVTAAADTVAKAAADAKKTITEADVQNRRALTETVESAKRDLTGEVRRLFGGDNPELLERLQPLLERFGGDLEAKVQAGTTALLDRVARQFDPADPTSPMAKHSAALHEHQRSLAERIDKQHTELTGKVDELVTAVRIGEARRSLAKVTPIKGGSFEDQVHELMREIAGGLGEEYLATGNTVGHLPRSKKGDGVMTVADGTARVVVEMTDSVRPGWNAYLDQAERNRDAGAALGLVRTPEQNGGQALRVLGSRRVVMAFDPGHDDPELLRTVVLLLRTVAITATARTGAAEIATAEEKIAGALAELVKIDGIKSAANTIQKSAEKIEGESAGLRSAIRRALDEALTALAGAGQPPAPGGADGIQAGAA